MVSSLALDQQSHSSIILLISSDTGLPCLLDNCQALTCWLLLLTPPRLSGAKRKGKIPHLPALMLTATPHQSGDVGHLVSLIQSHSLTLTWKTTPLFNEVLLIRKKQSIESAFGFSFVFLLSAWHSEVRCIQMVSTVTRSQSNIAPLRFERLALWLCSPQI